MVAQIEIPWAELGGIGLLAAVLLYVILASYKQLGDQRKAFLDHINAQSDRDDRRTEATNRVMQENTTATQELREAVKDLTREVRTNGRRRG